MSRFDPGESRYFFISGRKGSGKSHLAWTLFEGYPYDRLVIDVTHDVGLLWAKPLGIDHEIIGPESVPLRWPERVTDDEAPYRTLIYQPDMGSKTAVDDMDRMIGVAMRHRRTLIWVDEIGAVTRANQTPPHLMQALHYGRHSKLSLIMCGPRPVNVDPLCLQQADIVATFQQNNRNDRKRIADNTGIPIDELDAAVSALGAHEYLWWDASKPDELLHYPALPPIRRTPVYRDVPE